MSALAVERQQNAGLDENLKAVADAEDQLAGVFEFLYHGSQVMSNLVAQNATRGDVVPIAEPARQAEDLKVRECPRLFQQLVHVPPLGNRPGPFESERRFQ